MGWVADFSWAAIEDMTVVCDGNISNPAGLSKQRGRHERAKTETACPIPDQSLGRAIAAQDHQRRAEHGTGVPAPMAPGTTSVADRHAPLGKKPIALALPRNGCADSINIVSVSLSTNFDAAAV